MSTRNGQTVQVIPSARRLVTSLRDVGYDFVHAVADLVDNSITAGASQVDIDVRFDGRDSWLRIADNGSGMSGSGITEAMRYGSQQKYEDDDLGKFGLGLKTASMSQCRRLTVASRADPDVNRIEVRQLDLDHIESSDEWEVFIVPADKRPHEVVAPLERGPGTVVFWQELDRVLGYKLPWGEKAKTGLLNLAEKLEQHLGMVFHRFLAGEVKRRKKLVMTMNGTTKIQPWDPFAREEKATEELPAAEIDVRTNDGVGIVRFQPYVLPPKERFSSETAFNRLSGPAKWNAQQGLYIYRANRMIQSGGWSWIRTIDEHTKLARASLDFFPDLDSAFEINVAKVRVTLPAQLRERLKGALETLVRRAQTVYRQSSHGTAGGHGGKGMVHVHVPRRRGRPRAGEGAGETGGSVVRRAIEEAAAQAGEEKALTRIVEKLRVSAPEVVRALGW